MSKASLSSAFRHALEGVFYMVRTQRNARIHAVVTTVVVALGLWLRVSLLEWAILILCIGLVFGLEALNSAVEAAVDLVAEDHHPLAKAAKDCAGGAVLIVAVLSVIVGALIFLPRLSAQLAW